jgi:hypothetical protein
LLPPIELELERSNRIAVLDGMVLCPERIVDAALAEARSASDQWLTEGDSHSEDLSGCSAGSAHARESASSIDPPIEPATVQPPRLAHVKDIPGTAAWLLARHGVVGEEELVRLLYLTLTSRLLERPISMVVKGPSSAGKSYVVERVCSLFPKTAYYFLTSMSEHALAYSREPLAHRMLIICEAAGLHSDVASYFLRTLLSEGRIRHETVAKTKNGMEPVLIEREGPTGVVLTTTAVSLHPENETRLLSVTARDTPEQTRAVMLAAARGGSRVPVTLECWRGLQTWLAGSDNRVDVPFAETLAKAIPPVAVRLRRDFETMLNLIRSHAVLHQLNRSRDESGRIVATMDDYAAIRGLLADVLSDQVQATVSPTVRETVEAVAALSHEEEQVTYATLGQRLGLDKSAAQRRAKVAVSRGYLRNDEDRRGRPARLVIGDAMPEEQQLLPTRDELERLHGCS